MKVRRRLWICSGQSARDMALPVAVVGLMSGLGRFTLAAASLSLLVGCISPGADQPAPVEPRLPQGTDRTSPIQGATPAHPPLPAYEDVAHTGYIEGRGVAYESPVYCSFGTAEFELESVETVGPFTQRHSLVASPADAESFWVRSVRYQSFFGETALERLRLSDDLRVLEDATVSFSEHPELWSWTQFQPVPNDFERFVAKREGTNGWEWIVARVPSGGQLSVEATWPAAWPGNLFGTTCPAFFASPNEGGDLLVVTCDGVYALDGTALLLWPDCPLEHTPWPLPTGSGGLLLYTQKGVRAIDGADPGCGDQFLDGAPLPFQIESDPTPELLLGRLIYWEAVDDTGEPLWAEVTSYYGGSVRNLGKVAVADLDGDGTSELIIGRSAGGLDVLDSDLSLLWRRSGQDSGTASVPVVHDFGADGHVEVLSPDSDGLAVLDGLTGLRLAFIPRWRRSYDVGVVQPFNGEPLLFTSTENGLEFFRMSGEGTGAAGTTWAPLYNPGAWNPDDGTILRGTPAMGGASREPGSNIRLTGALPLEPDDEGTPRLAVAIAWDLLEPLPQRFRIEHLPWSNSFTALQEPDNQRYTEWGPATLLGSVELPGLEGKKVVVIDDPGWGYLRIGFDGYSGTSRECSYRDNWYRYDYVAP